MSCMSHGSQRFTTSQCRLANCLCEMLDTPMHPNQRYTKSLT